MTHLVLLMNCMIYSMQLNGSRLLNRHLCGLPAFFANAGDHTAAIGEHQAQQHGGKQEAREPALNSRLVLVMDDFNHLGRIGTVCSPGMGVFPAQERSAFLEIGETTFAGDTDVARAPFNGERSKPEGERGP